MHSRKVTLWNIYIYDINIWDSDHIKYAKLNKLSINETNRNKIFQKFHVRYIFTQWHHLVSGIFNKIGSGYQWPPIRCQAIIGTNTGLLTIGPSVTNFSKIWIKILNLRSGAIITRSNIIWYCIQHNSDWSRTYIKVTLTKYTHNSPVRTSYGVSIVRIL